MWIKASESQCRNTQKVPKLSTLLNPFSPKKECFLMECPEQSTKKSTQPAHAQKLGPARGMILGAVQMDCGL